MAIPLTESISGLFSQLEQLLEQLSNDQYQLPLKVLSGASIGQHMRHIIEFYIELDAGYNKGYVDYDARKRNPAIEAGRIAAAAKLREIKTCINKEDRPLMVIASYDNEKDKPYSVQTNYYRELLYNLEHTVHHMALIRVGIHAFSQIALPESFGVAASTIRYKNSMAR